MCINGPYIHNLDYRILINGMYGLGLFSFYLLSSLYFSPAIFSLTVTALVRIIYVFATISNAIPGDTYRKMTAIHLHEMKIYYVVNR